MLARTWTPRFAAALALLATAAFAEGEETAPMDQDAMMEAYAASMAPGKYHERLDWLVGHWTTKTTMHMGPETMINEGTATFEWALGGRYVHSSHVSEWNDMPFEGRGIDGFDNTSGKYFNLWFDSMGTGFMLTEGEPSTEPGVQELTGTFEDPLRGPMKVRFVSRRTGDDSYDFEMHSTFEGESEMKVMEIKYTRTKS